MILPQGTWPDGESPFLYLGRLKYLMFPSNLSLVFPGKSKLPFCGIDKEMAKRLSSKTSLVSSSFIWL